jgi:NADH:ubiquinone oxidoreductase subunit H
MAGWSSNSSYALLGSLRAIAQTISYEVALVLILIRVLFILGGFNLLLFELFQENI